MGILRVRFSQSSERRGVFNYALKVEVTGALGIPQKIFVYHQSPSGVDGNVFAEFDHIATPVDFQEIPEDAASETVPWYRTDKCVLWFRNVSDMELAKQLFVDDINALRRTFDVLTSENNFARQTDVEFSGAGVSEPDEQKDKNILEEIEAMKKEMAGKLSKDAMSGICIDTGTVEDMRNAVKDIGSTLGAKISRSIAAKTSVVAFFALFLHIGALGAGFSGERFGNIDLDENPMIVTNVTFDGLATLTDITNVVDSISTNFVPALRKEIADVSKAGTNYVDSSTNDLWNATTNAIPVAATSLPKMDGTAYAGTSNEYARADHVHPSDTSKQDALTFDNAPTTGSDNPVKSGGIWKALWGEAATASSSVYDWVVDQLGLKRDYTDLSYDTKETIEVPVIRATVSGGGQSIVADLECSETVPDPPAINHVYTWQNEVRGLKITQGHGALVTTWTLYVGGNQEGSYTTQNATQGYYPDLSFSVESTGGTVTTTKTTAQKPVTREDSLALTSQIPAVVAPSTSASDSGKAADAKATGDALAGTASKADATLSTGNDWVWDSPAPKYNDENVVLKLLPYPYQDIAPRYGYCWTAFTISGDQCSVAGDEQTRDDGNSRTSVTVNINGVGYTARRSAIGFVLGSQTDKPLQIAGDYATNADVDAKRDKADLAVYEHREGVDRWDVVNGTGATTALPLTSTSGISTTYSNGNAYGRYRLVTYDYRQAGGDEFLVTVFRNTGITSIQWTKVIVSPERSTGEITETEAAAQGLRFVHVREEEGLFPTEDTLALTSDFSTNNAALVETIEATAPAPGDYAAVSNAAVHAAITNALQDAALTNMHNWVVGKLSEYRGKLDLNVYGRGNASVSFPAGYSVIYDDDTYRTKNGETIEFFGPIPSTATPQYSYWVPYEYKDEADFDPQAQMVWCLWGDTEKSAPLALMYGTGALYMIDNWDTEAPALTLSSGEASGGEPTMARPISATGDTLANASQLDGKQDNLPYPTNAIPYAAITGKPSLATVATSGSYNDLSNTPQINGRQLSGNKTGADLGVLDLAGGTMTGDLIFDSYLHGVKFYDNVAPSMFRSRWDNPADGMVFDFLGGTDGAHLVRLFCSRPGRVALAALSPTAGNIAALDTDGNPVDSFIAATNVALKTDISPTEPAFSNAVLAVGLGIDTNTVAAINELVDSAHDLPVSGATSVGALLLALAAAVAALKGNKADKPTNPTNGNLVKVSGTGELQDAGYHLEVHNGIPCIVQYT